MAGIFNNSDIVVPLGDDSFTLDRCTKSFLITGAVGSGKTSGSASYLALNFLSKGFGGLVLTAKTEEADRWEKLCYATGRENDVVRLNEHSDLIFDPLLYQSLDKGSNDVMIIVALIMSISKVASRVNHIQGGGGNPFFDLATRRILSEAIALLKPTDSVSFQNIDKLVRSSLAYIDWQSQIKKDPQIILPDQARYFAKTLKSLIPYATENDIIHAVEYFKEDLPRIPAETRNSIIETLYTKISPFLKGILAKNFTGSVSPELLPESTFEGKIIILDFPIKEKYELAIIAQTLYKRMFQRAVERRPETPHMRPTFLFADEAHLFIEQGDDMFLTTARSKRCCTVLITQSISNFLSVLPSNKAKNIVDTILSCLVTKIIHFNNDAYNNEYFSRIIGKHYDRIRDVKRDTPTSEWRYQNHVEPNRFLTLKTGREENEYAVEAIIVSEGNWSNDKHYKRFTFDQRLVSQMVDKRNRTRV